MILCDAFPKENSESWTNNGKVSCLFKANLPFLLRSHRLSGYIVTAFIFKQQRVECFVSNSFIFIFNIFNIFHIVHIVHIVHRHMPFFKYFVS